MARREYTYSPPCAEEGCTERAHYYFSTRREQQETMESTRKRGGWRCTRHSQPDRVLTPGNLVREIVLTSYAESYGVFWREEGKASGSGFTYGPGFKAFAEDFPVGTRLVVSARIEPPESGS